MKIGRVKYWPMQSNKQVHLSKERDDTKLGWVEMVVYDGFAMGDEDLKMHGYGGNIRCQEKKRML